MFKTDPHQGLETVFGLQDSYFFQSGRFRSWTTWKIPILNLNNMRVFYHWRMASLAWRASCSVISSHVFGSGPKPGCSDSARAGIIESHNFLSYVLSWWNCKTHVIPRTLNGFWKVYRWRSFVKGYAKFGERATQRLGKTVLQNCSDFSIPLGAHA